MGERLYRARGVCTVCGRTIAGRSAGPEKRAADRRWVELVSHVRNPTVRHPTPCPGPGHRVPRVPPDNATAGG